MLKTNFSMTIRAVSFILLYLFITTDSTGLSGVSSRYLPLASTKNAEKTIKGLELLTSKSLAAGKTLKALRGGEDRKLRIALCSWECLYTVAVGGVAPHVTELAAGLTRR
jgi:hypothetical protein